MLFTHWTRDVAAAALKFAHALDAEVLFTTISLAINCL